jgi:5-methylcytosine-specific restriction endonuclease McrA
MKTPEERRLAKKAAFKKWREANLEKIKKYRMANRHKDKEYREANREKCRLRGQKFRKENPEKSAASSKKWAKENREKVNEKAKKWYHKNKEKCQASARRYCAKNREKCLLASMRRYYEYPEEASARRHLRYARLRNATIGNPKIIAKWEKSWRTKKFAICYWCSVRVFTKTCHMDHINPLAKGGSHSIENLCISCQPCNNKKCASDLQTWNSRIEQPVMF